MLPSSLEVAQSLRASWSLIDRGEQALADFDLSVRGFLRSYGAALLTAPAVIAVLAAERMRNGLSNEGGLFNAPELALKALMLPAMSYVVLPGLILALFWGVARTARGTGFVIVWNWSEVIVTLLLAVPAAMFAAGWIDGRMAFAVTLAFALIAARLRYAVARSALGIGAPMAVSVVILVFGIEIAAAWTLAVGRF